jgi:alkylation response protein AidB-like acyl-CoA dehydrogenase
MMAPFPPLDVANAIADDLLFPTALATDTADQVPRSHLDRLADAGLYGLFGPGDAGGMGADPATRLSVIEALAGGCLSTTFVWIQHHSALLAVAASATPGLRDAFVGDMCRGKWRAGIAVAGIRPGVPGVSAEAVTGGWRVNGDVPWVTGWGLIDVMHTAALGPDGAIVWMLIDAVVSSSLSVTRLRMVAVESSVTVVVSFRDHFVPAERTTSVEPNREWMARDARGLRTNGSLALGVARRCCRLLGPSPLDEELAACRERLDHAAVGAPDTLPGARADSSVLAARAAAALVVATGSQSVLRDQHPQRLAREATFLLVFASRPPIRAALRAVLESRAPEG